MNTKVFWLSLIVIFISFVGGFLLANAFNRTELNDLRAENERLKNSQEDKNSVNSQIALSDEEIRRKIAEADQNPNNFAFQKSLGIALYRYATMKQDTELLAEVARLLNRAVENNPKDYDVIVTLGNIYFDIGYFKKENDKLQKAREFYQKVLEQKPKDADVRTDFGLTYFLETPPETEKAIVEFQKSLKENPKHEKTLQVLTEALLSQNKTEDAEKYLAKLKEVNQNNPSVSHLTTQLSQAENNGQK
ncbi:MAG: tetratricopeptide repeat protein [Acidobacteria bacterium]|nr:tetratricopeptide repeat protein [Acidobacteriota bacterium]